MRKLVTAVAFATLIASPTFAQSYDLSVGSGSVAWVGPLLLLAIVVITGVVIGFLARPIGGAAQRELELDLVRREMLDECFAKGEMFREDCEGRCKGLAHARETTHTASLHA